MNRSDTKLIYLTAGAGGMFCGSCMHDNALSRALAEAGWAIQLVPTYTPIRTDEDNVSVDQVLFGGINVFLQQKIPLLRHMPAFLDRFLDSPWLIRKVTSRAMETNPVMLGKLAHSMLLGTHGNQRKEVTQLVKWLRLNRPQLLIFSNILIGGCIEQIKAELNIPVLVTLQGDDVFLDQLQEPYRQRCLDRIRELVPQVDGFIVQSEFFREYMADYFAIPRDRFRITPLGIETGDFARFEARHHAAPTAGHRPAIGYLARLAPEKGLHRLVDAFLELKSRPGTESIVLKIAGWLGPDQQHYAQAQFDRLEAAGLGPDFEYLGAIDRAQKLDFLADVDLLSVPTEFQEPKGLYALEALAAGVPLVLPRHGAFPELVEASQGGILVEPDRAVELADQWQFLLANPEVRQRLAQQGRAFVLRHRNAQRMADTTSEVIEEFLAGRAPG